MGIQLTVDSLEGVSESLRGAYVETESGFQLDPDKYAETAKQPLLSKNKQLLDKLAKAKAAEERAAKFEGITDDDFDAFQQWREQQASGGQQGKDDGARAYQEAMQKALRKQEENLTAKFKPVEEENASLRGILKAQTKETVLMQRAGRLGLIPERATAFLKTHGERFDVPDLQTREVVAIENGEPSIHTIEQVLLQIREAEPWWFAASDKGGSGAPSGNTAGGARKNEMTRAAFDQLSPIEQMNFVRGGGKLKDR